MSYLINLNEVCYINFRDLNLRIRNDYINPLRRWEIEWDALRSRRRCNDLLEIEWDEFPFPILPGMDCLVRKDLRRLKLILQISGLMGRLSRSHPSRNRTYRIFFFNLDLPASLF